MSQVSYEARAQMTSHAPGPGGSRATPWLASVATAFSSGEVEVISVPLNAEPATVDELALCLSDGERLKASRFVFGRDRRRFVVARAWLRRMLGSRLGLQPEAVEFEYGPRGKPALSPQLTESQLRFNVSHSEDIAVYAFARGREVGIDVEAVRAIEDADAIVGRFFSAHEYRAYRTLDPRDKPLAFFNCWTRKEAFIKAIGDGLYHPLDSFDVSLAPGEPARILRVGDVPGESCGWHLETFSPAPGFVAAVVYAAHES